MTSNLIHSRFDKKCGASAIADNKVCHKLNTTIATNGADLTRLLLTSTGVAATGAILGTLSRDLFNSGVPDDKVPPKKPPEGLYDSFNPGDLIYQTNNFAGANRAHYAVYLGKIKGEHKVFDTALKKVGGSTTSRMSIRSIEDATDTGTSYALATREDKGANARPTREQLMAIVTRLNNRSFDWTGFESNCETFARAIVNDLPVSTQTKDVSPMSVHLTKALVSALAPEGYRRRAVKQQNIQNLVKRTMQRDSMNSRQDQRCGASGIPDNAKCHKGGSWPQVATIGAALAAGGITAYALTRGSSSPPNPKRGPSRPPHLPGLTPRALLAAAPPRQSKTQRMQANTAAAVSKAEGAIAQTAREEVRRIGQIGNTMAAAGEAAGMATKTTLRELRLRTEAARRRFEPGYRSPQPRRLPAGTQAQLPGNAATPEREAVPINPRTGQPRRRRASGFGRPRGDNFIQHYAPVRLQPPS